MSKNINDAFFVISSNLGNEQENFISAVGNLCPETKIVSVNRLGINQPGILAKTWNINKATFLISASSPATVNSIINQLNTSNFQTICIDGPSKTSDLFNDSGYISKNELNDGILIIKNHEVISLEKPSVPSILIFDGNNYSWDPI